ncbi:hypothetical protein ACEPAF_4517 [Sanghuangporus sanghuang]
MTVDALSRYHALTFALLGVSAIPSVFAASSSSSTAQPANPTAPNYVDDVTWLTGYLTIHSLSVNSYAYMFLFWFGVALVFFGLSWATWTGMRATSLGARWNKWALRRRTWRKKHTLKAIEEEARKKGVPVSAVHRQPKSLPSNAQIMTATVLVIVTLVICFVGPDYINPDLPLFDFSGSSSSSSSSSSSGSTTKKARLTAPINDQTMNAFIAHYNIQKSWWTSAARTGGVAFALFPLVVALALKSPPFAIFGIPGLVQFGHDKTIRLHRYVGRLIYFVTLLHVLFWVVQVLKDRRELTGELVFAYVWKYQKFRFAWVAFLSMTILMIFSLDCIRTPHYELFYIVHIVFTPMTIIFSALHHPQRGCWAWCAAALALWAGERLWRAFWWCYVNGIFGIKRKKNVGVGSISPYTYHTGLNEKEGMSDGAGAGVAGAGNRPSAPSRGSTVTLINSTNPMKDSFDGKQLRQENEDEQYEMNALRAPALRRLGAPDIGAALGLGNENDYAHTPNQSGPPSTFGASLESLAYGSTHEDGPTPTPGELIELAHVQTGNSGSSTPARGMPLQIQTAHAPTLAYPPQAHPRFASAQSPGAGPGPRSATARHQQQHQFQPHLPKTTFRHARYVPPPGFALATLLPGRTIRLRLVTPGYQTWAPGQHFLIGIPAVSRFTTHPFSVASVCDEQAALHADPDTASEDGNGNMKKIVRAEAGREAVFFVRAKKGWTKRLWDLVSSLQSQGLASAPGEDLPEGYSPPLAPGSRTPGVVLRALVDGPFGTAGRTKWGKYSSVFIIAGGSGVAFGLSVLEYVCLCIAGRDGRFLGGYPGGWGVGPKGAWVTQRVRFVWLVREYAHIQWCVGSLRRCLQIVPTDALELNIFVTNHRPPQELGISPTSAFPSASTEGQDDLTDDGHLKPPAPRFFAGRPGGSPNNNRKSSTSPLASEESLAADASVDSIVDSYFEGHDGRGVEYGTSELGHETHLLDYTNFDGDDDTPMPGEHRLSRRIIKESKTRRALSRKRDSAIRAKKELEERVKAGGYFGQPKSPDEEQDAYGGIVNGNNNNISNRSSMHSTAPLLSGDGAQGVSPISMHSLSPIDHYPNSRAQFPPSAFTSFGASANELSSSSSSSNRRDRGLSVGSTMSSSTLKSPNTSTPSLTPSGGGPPNIRWAPTPALTPTSTSDTLSPWSGSSASGALGSGLAIDPQEAFDLQIVSEWARPGKPKLGKILADEVECAKGRVAVACCGPTSLNALMRKYITQQIDPSRVARGDMRGSIDFIAEDFEY